MNYIRITYLFIITLSLFANNKLFSMEAHNTKKRVERLDWLCIEKILSHDKLTRKIVNSPLFPYDDQLSARLQSTIRTHFSKNNNLLNNSSKQSITKQHLNCSGIVHSAGYDPSHQSIIANCYIHKTVDLYEYGGKEELAKYSYVFDMDGKVKNQGYFHYDLSGCKPLLKKNAKKKLQALYGFPSHSEVVLIDENKFLIKDDYLYFYDVSRRNALKKFLRKRIPLKQLFFIITVDHAQKQNKRVALTEIEQGVYSGLLPEFKNVMKDSIVSYQDLKDLRTYVSPQFWCDFGKGVLLSPHSPLKPIEYKE